MRLDSIQRYMVGLYSQILEIHFLSFPVQSRHALQIGSQESPERYVCLQGREGKKNNCSTSEIHYTVRKRIKLDLKAVGHKDSWFIYEP